MTVNLQAPDDECKPFGFYAKAAILDLIRLQTDPVERQEWARIAIEQGTVTASDVDGLF